MTESGNSRTNATGRRFPVRRNRSDACKIRLNQLTPAESKPERRKRVSISLAISGSPFLKTDGAIETYDDMINDRNPNDLGSALKSLRDRKILITRRRIAARVIVNDENTVCGIANCGSKEFARVHETAPQRTYSDSVTVDRSVLRIERDDPELLLLAFSGNSTETTQADSDCGGGACNAIGRRVFAFQFRNPKAHLNSGFQPCNCRTRQTATDRLNLHSPGDWQLVQSDFVNEPVCLRKTGGTHAARQESN